MPTEQGSVSAQSSCRPARNPRTGAGPKCNPIFAFGEFKTIQEWSRDRRCLVTAAILRGRVHAGEAAEQAMTRLWTQGARYRRKGYASGLSRGFRHWMQLPPLLSEVECGASG